MRLFTLTQHAYAKIGGDAVLAAQVLDAAEYPHVTYGVTNQRNTLGQRQQRHIRNGMVAVVDPISHKVITFYADVVETDIRPDQTDEAAQEYAAKRAEASKSDRAARDAKRRDRQNRDRAFTIAQKGKKA